MKFADKIVWKRQDEQEACLDGFYLIHISQLLGEFICKNVAIPEIRSFARVEDLTLLGFAASRNTRQFPVKLPLQLTNQPFTLPPASGNHFERAALRLRVCAAFFAEADRCSGERRAAVLPPRC